ncbi:MAG: phosphatidate cytidylyltransferase [Thermotogae bacterium]|nr:phosphatidate cytidylyltransferase [Thermotogota bacterium]
MVSKREIKVRVITAVVIAPFVVACFVNYYSLIGLVATVIIIAVYEYLSTVLRKHMNPLMILVGSIIITGASIFYGLAIIKGFKAPELVYAITFFILSGLALEHSKDPKVTTEFILYSVMGMVYISLGLSFFYRLFLDFGKALAAMVLLSVWMFDSCAYFFGIRFGRIKISPIYSPHKSLEGILGGFSGTLLFVFLYSRIAGLLGVKTVNGWEILLIPIAVSLMDTLGDITESAVKRYVGVKDMGNVLPGHGGMLDRIDGLLFVAPTVYLLLSLMRGSV